MGLEESAFQLSREAIPVNRQSALDSRFHSNHESVEDHNVDSLDYDSQPDSTMVTEQDCSESASSVLHYLPERRVCIVSKRNINL